MTSAPGAASRSVPPALSRALDREVVLHLLSEHLPECREGMQLLDARLEAVHYTARSTARVLWKLNVRDAETGRRGRQLVSVSVLGKGQEPPPEPYELVRRYGEVRGHGDTGRTMPLRTPWLVIPDSKLLVSAFPLDPKLPTLLDVMHPATMREALHRAWQPRNVRVRKVRVEDLSYTPGARAALRFEVHAEDKESGLPELRRLVGKLHVRRTPARLFAGHWAVWRASLGRVSIAPPVGYVAGAELSLQEFLTGTRLSEFAHRGAFVGLLRQTARSIATVHSLLLPLLAVRGVEKELSTVDRWIGLLSRLRPAHAPRLEKLATRLKAELATRLRITGTIHADFHLANVLTDPDGVTLIDWDQVAHGDPMVDVGRVLASLRVTSLRVHGTLDGLVDAQEQFLSEYLRRTGDDERRARLFEASCLLNSAAAPFRLQRGGWEEGAERMLDEVDRVLALSAPRTRVGATSAGAGREVPFQERARWAADRPYAQALLVPVLRDSIAADIEVTECSPRIREQSEHILHVGWTLKGYRGKERWRGALEGVGFPDHSGRGLWRRLEAAGEAAERHPESLRLPRPIAHLAPLSMLVFVPEQGLRLTKLLGGEGEERAVRRLGRGLAAFQAMSIAGLKESATARQLASVGRRVERLVRGGVAVGSEVGELFERLQPLFTAVGERRVSTVRGLCWQNLWVGDRLAGAGLVSDVVLGEPLLTVGELQARLRTRAFAKRRPPSAAAQLGAAYLEASGRSERELAAFEALYLIESVCGRASRPDRGRLIHPLLTATRGLVERASG